MCVTLILDLGIIVHGSALQVGWAKTKLTASTPRGGGQKNEGVGVEQDQSHVAKDGPQEKCENVDNEEAGTNSSRGEADGNKSAKNAVASDCLSCAKDGTGDASAK